ncbi:hypothetical protein [Xanthomonas campestris]|uniref:hypothetical protein n=1 Tax=Xanthomonas campestris TaxID=339 RepID=UPI001E3D8B54|nr:hypothetical protein [Xanthomonas campestris]MCC4605472.1 hypothetical protein [Xanthomonas campestris pv. parthenii]
MNNSRIFITFLLVTTFGLLENAAMAQQPGSIEIKAQSTKGRATLSHFDLPPSNYSFKEGTEWFLEKPTTAGQCQVFGNGTLTGSVTFRFGTPWQLVTITADQLLSENRISLGFPVEFTSGPLVYPKIQPLFMSSTLLLENFSHEPINIGTWPGCKRILSFGNNHWNVAITGAASSIPMCEVGVSPEIIDLGDINAIAVSQTAAGHDIVGHSGTADISVTCNYSGYIATVSTTKVSGPCIGTNTNVLRFCVEMAGKRLDLSSGSDSITGTGAIFGSKIKLEIFLSGLRGFPLRLACILVQPTLQ